MGTVVLDSADLNALVKDATGEGLPELPTDDNASSGAKVTEPPEKAAEPPKTDPTPAEDSEDVEGEDGLTPRQKKDLTAKMQAAIGKKHRMLKDAEEFAAEQYNEKRLAEQRAEALDREIQRLKAQLGTKPDAPADDGKPKRENFATEDAFRDAVDDWRVDQKFRAREAEENQKREQARQAEVVATAKSRIARALELVPDYAEVTEAADMVVPPVVAGYMQESEMFAELGYHFAKHPEVLERISVMPPAKQLVEIGKIESKLEPFSDRSEKADTSNGATPSLNGKKAEEAKPSTETGSTPSKPRVSAPIRPLSSGSAVQVDKPEGEKSTREVIADWSKRRSTDLNRRKRH